MQDFDIIVEHNSENPYTMINNNTLWDTSLSQGECLLLIRCLSRPRNWKFNARELSKACNVNIDTMNKYINGLIKAGYAIRIKTKVLHESGKMVFGRSFVSVFERKISEQERIDYIDKFQKKFPQRKLPGLEVSGLKDPLLIKNECTKEESTKKVCISKETKKERTISFPCGKRKEEMEGLKAYIESNEISIRPHILIRWFNKWDGEHIAYHLNKMLECKTPIRSHEAWMEKALSENYSALEDNILINKTYAEEFSKEKNWKGLVVLKKYCKLPYWGHEIHYSLQPESFKILMEEYYKSFINR